MKHRMIHLFLAASLLAFGAAVLGGCGTNQDLSSLTLSPETPFVAKGKTLQLSVTAGFSGGMTVPSWTNVTWSSSDPAIAAVSSTGLVSGLAAGTAVIRATDIGHPDIAASVTANVTELVSITVTPTDAVISAGSTTQFTATGLYTLETPTWPPDLTPLVSWASSTTDVALISMETGSQGFATAVSAGTTTITATDPVTGITGTATLTVTP